MDHGLGAGQEPVVRLRQRFLRQHGVRDRDWSYRSASLDSALAAAALKTGRALDAVEPDLRGFAARGGKPILYHRSNDSAISALNSIDYYDSVVSAMGRDRASAFLRLYLVPGVQHCGDGPGPSSFDPQATDPRRDSFLALQSWVESGSAPAAIVATKYEVDPEEAPGRGKVRMTRPLCPYPERCGVPRPGRHERRRELRVREEVTRQGLPAAFAAGAAPGLPIAKTLCIPRT